jgi:hypothetical protein
MKTDEMRIGDRKKAYGYIRAVVINRVNFVRSSPIVSDVDLADVLGGTFGLKDDLKSLREGKSDPSQRLIKAFKDLVGPIVHEDEIDSYLVTPFSAES